MATELAPVSPNADPDLERLRRELDLLKGEYIKLQTDKQGLLEHTGPQLEALYAVRVGQPRLALLEVQLEAERLRRLCQRLQAALNRREAVDLDQLAFEVDVELLNLRQQLTDQAAQVHAAQHLLRHLHSPEKSDEVRRLYRQLAKRLHPDVNPALSPADLRLWHAVQAAYQYGDLPSLRAYALLAPGDELPEDQPGHPATLAEAIRQRLPVLAEGIRQLLAGLEAIRAKFPFTLEKQLKDDAWLAEQQQLLAIELAATREQITLLQARYDALRAAAEDA